MRFVWVWLVGVCLFYNPNVMERVAAYRQLECAECVGTVAVPDCGQLGERIWLERDGGVEGPFLVVDCAAEEDRERLTQRGLVAEVDWLTAQRWQMFGPVSCQSAAGPYPAAQWWHMKMSRIE